MKTSFLGKCAFICFSVFTAISVLGCSKASASKELQPKDLKQSGSVKMLAPVKPKEFGVKLDMQTNIQVNKAYEAVIYINQTMNTNFHKAQRRVVIASNVQVNEGASIEVLLVPSDADSLEIKPMSETAKTIIAGQNSYRIIYAYTAKKTGEYIVGVQLRVDGKEYKVQTKRIFVKADVPTMIQSILNYWQAILGALAAIITSILVIIKPWKKS